MIRDYTIDKIFCIDKCIETEIEYSTYPPPNDAHGFGGGAGCGHGTGTGTGTGHGCGTGTGASSSMPDRHALALITYWY